MLIKVRFGGYYVFDLSALDTLTSGIKVEGEGYGKDAKYIPQEPDIDIELIKDSQLVLDEQETIDVLRKQLKEAKDEKSKQWNKAYSLEQETKKLKEKLATIEKLCPHPLTEPTGE